MTTETKVETASSAKANGFRYVRSDSVAVVSVSGGRSDAGIPLRTVLRACVARFEGFLPGWLRALPKHRILLFVATPISDQYNALSRLRGVWGTDDLDWLPPNASRSPSVEITAEQGGLRFVGLADVGEASLLEATDFARTHGGSFLWISAREALTEADVRSTVAKVFPRQESAVDWAGVVALVEDGEDICIRSSGGFDDREVAIDAFLSESLLRKVGAP